MCKHVIQQCRLYMFHNVTADHKISAVAASFFSGDGRIVFINL